MIKYDYSAVKSALKKFLNGFSYLKKKSPNRDPLFLGGKNDFFDKKIQIFQLLNPNLLTKILKFECISNGMLRFCSTALTKRLREEQVRGWISITIEDMTMILFPAYRSIRGGL